ncbi:peptidylprolyl isomerase [Salibacteraceae bacterium]|nr:peptidylprolyl isomerase [Salibacteraceae bacterium]
MCKKIVVAIGLLLTIQAGAQDQRQLMSIGEEKIEVEEFLSIYNKNNTNNVVDKKTMEEYVDLFVNFKLKVIEAESMGMDTATKFVKELSGYRKQLAQPYLVDMDVNEGLIQEAYNRLTEDVAAYHVLVKVGLDATAGDTLMARKKLASLTKSIKSEEDMQIAIAKIKGSKDDQVIAEDLGYFTAFSMVYPFESAAYNTEVGKLSKPVRTRYGYHAIFIRDKRPARGEIQVSHIFIRSNSTDTEDQKETAKNRIVEINKQLKSGEAFGDLVKQYSEDKATVNNGGTLPWFGTGGTASVFEDAAFGLTQNGEVSEPIKSAYGWHIIKRVDKRDVAELEAIKPTLKRKIEKDSRSLKGRTSLLKKLKSDYAITYNKVNKANADRIFTEQLLSGKWRVPEELPSKMDDPVLTISDNKLSKTTKAYTQLDYIQYVAKNQKKSKEGQVVSSILTTMWNQFVDDMIIDFEDGLLEMKYPKFKALMQEYHDGILLFDLMDQKVWSKAVKDSSGLEAFYQSHKSDYLWPQRVDASIYDCADDAVAAKAVKYANKRIKKGYTDTYIMQELNNDNALNVNIKSGLFAKGDESIIDNSPWVEGIYTSKESTKPSVVQVYSVINPQPKELNEARGLITSAYQSYLEKQWIEELKKKYPVQLDEAVFKSINK